jgi:hypothetical protein
MGIKDLIRDESIRAHQVRVEAFVLPVVPPSRSWFYCPVNRVSAIQHFNAGIVSLDLS